MLNSEEHDLDNKEEEMSKKTKGRKRIYNPTTGGTRGGGTPTAR